MEQYGNYNFFCSLLNFQESVNAEMEASVLLGKGFNMQRMLKATDRLVS